MHGLRFGLVLLAALLVHVSDSRAAGALHFDVRVTVPTVCSIGRLEPSAPGVLLFEEFCNAAEGYRIFVRHDPARPGETLRFRYGGRWLLANPAGLTLLADEPQAGRYRRSLEVQSLRPTMVGITLSIVPRIGP